MQWMRHTAPHQNGSTGWLHTRQGLTPKREVTRMEASGAVAQQSKPVRSTQEALTRAISGHSLSNFPAIFAGFAAKGIPEAEITPRENVFTFDAWKKLRASHLFAD